MTATPPPAQAHERSGFTLIELLVVLAVLSLVLTLAFGAFRLTATIPARIDDRSRDTDDIVAVQSFLRDLLAHAYPAVISPEPTHYRISFQGKKDSLEFTSTLPHIAAFGHQRIALYRAARDGASPLLLAWQVERNETASLAAERPERIVLDGLERLEFRYFGRARGAKEPAWSDTWLDQTALPRIVSIAVKVKDAPAWPPLDVTPQIDVDASCVVDLLSHRCRGR